MKRSEDRPFRDRSNSSCRSPDEEKRWGGVGWRESGAFKEGLRERESEGRMREAGHGQAA